MLPVANMTMECNGPTDPTRSPTGVDAQNSAVTAMNPILKAHAFKPGQSGNPGGRPKGFAHRIRELTDDGAELVEQALGVLRNEDASLKDQAEARHWLADHGFGKCKRRSKSVAGSRM
jgi:Family of unknown function (DUF5681)